MKLKISVLLISILIYAEAGILYPKYNLRRRLLSLDGLWKFALSGTGTFNNNESLTGNADDKDVHLMPVPSSYNDVLTSTIGRDYLGDVTYKRNFLVPKTWQFESDRIWLRFASVSYSAEVHINGEFALSHKIGHLPFQKEITSLVNGSSNTITVKVNNNLTDSTIPQGAVQTLSDGRIKQTYSFDFFNYAGIDRPVILYSTPIIYIDDITIGTTIDGTTGQVSYNIRMNGYIEINIVNVTYKVTILDNDRNVVVSRTDTFANIDDGNFNTVDIANANFWWPYLMSKQPGYQYTLKVETTVHTEKTTISDEYEQKFGIRQLGWNETTVTINGKPIYIRGLGRHEDSDIRGKGVDLPLIVREHNLLRWLGVNCYRTSHYPYAEETMDLADSLGIMIIDESPAVELSSYNDELLLNHRLSLREMYLRDKNRPSVIIWSVANEPTTILPEAVDYFGEVVTYMKSLDDTRPVTLVNWQTIDQAQNVFNFLDIISYNRYQGWYQNTANASAIPDALVEELTQWHETYNKPVLITEYGADSLSGEYSLPSYVWSESYQSEVLSKHFEAFDTVRQEGWFLGEMIWNFADFKTSQSCFRVGGNKKGIFTRERQPKAAANLLRERYWALAEIAFSNLLLHNCGQSSANKCRQVEKLFSVESE